MGHTAERIRRAGIRIGLGMIRRSVMGKLSADATPVVADGQLEKEMTEYDKRVQELLTRHTKPRSNVPAVERETKVLSVPQ